MWQNASKKSRIILLGLVITGILLAGYIIWYTVIRKVPEPGGDNAGVVLAETQDWNLDLAEDDPGGAEEAILIPGYGTVEMESERLEIPISLGNPKENNCYFKVTVILSDNTLLYESDYIEPGQGIVGVPLKKEIASGTYEIALSYRCFSMDGQLRKLNGAESGFVLIVS